MADLKSLADAAAQRLALISDRAATVARGIAFLTLSSMGLAYVVGSIVLPDVWKWLWIIGGLFLCAIPAIAILIAYRRLRRVPQTYDRAVSELQSIMSDTEVRKALFELVDRPEEQDRQAALFELGREMNSVRRVLTSHKEEVVTVYEDVRAITTLPGLVTIAVVGSLGGLIFCVVVVLAKFIF